MTPKQIEAGAKAIDELSFTFHSREKREIIARAVLTAASAVAEQERKANCRAMKQTDNSPRTDNEK